MKKQTSTSNGVISRIVASAFLFAFAFVALSFIPQSGLVSNTLAYTSPGAPHGFVNDFAGILNGDQVASLEGELRRFEASTSNEIAVVTIKSLGGETIESYAEKLFKEYGIGKDKKDNGVLLLIALDDHKSRIEVGYGLEGALTDIQASSITRNEINSRFKENDYFGGIEGGVHSIMSATKGEYTASESSKGAGLTMESINLLLVIGVVLFQFLLSVMARTKSWYLGGILGGIAGAIISFLGLFGAGLFVTLAAIGGLGLVGLLFDYVVSKNHIKNGRSGSSWLGSGGGWGGSGRGGGGGFGGFGGGSSGGGGASGSW